MSILTASQKTAIKQIRALAWNKPFTVEHIARTPGVEYYDSPIDEVSTETLCADWVWNTQLRTKGSPGGEFGEGDLLLSTDILNSGAFVVPRETRIVVDGIRCAIVSVNPYEDSSEVVISAKRIENP